MSLYAPRSSVWAFHIADCINTHGPLHPVPVAASQVQSFAQSLIEASEAPQRESRAVRESQWREASIVLSIDSTDTREQ